MVLLSAAWALGGASNSAASAANIDAQIAAQSDAQSDAMSDAMSGLQAVKFIRRRHAAGSIAPRIRLV